METLLLVSAAWTLASAQYSYQQGMMDYLESRLLAIEDRMHLWHQHSHRYHTDLLDLQKLTSDAVAALAQEHEKLLDELDGAALRVDRVEREMDYVESQTAPRACVRREDKVLERGSWGLVRSRVQELDWEELRSSVSDCEDIISGIRSVKILKRFGSPKGMWVRDPRSSRVYLFNGTRGDQVFQYDSVRNFSESADVPRPIRLPSDWTGSGAAVYDDYLYFVKREDGSDLQVVKFDLLTRTVADAAMFPVEGRAGVYGLNPETEVDLAADGEGLWLLYGLDHEPNVQLAKMDAASLDIERIWDTRCPRAGAEAAFVACGTVYVVYNTRPPSRSRVQCVFDVNDAVTAEEAPLVYFPRRFGGHASLRYNPEEQQLYGWDDGYQIIYRLSMKRKLML